MNHTENSFSQLILDQQLLSAYRNGVANSQLRSLLNPSSLDLLSTTDELLSPSLTDSYILQALIPSMTPQEQLMTQIELLKRAAVPSSPFLYSPSVPSTSIGDIISILGSNNSLNNALLLNNSRSSIFASDSPFILDDQSRLGSWLTSGLGSLLPLSNDQMEEKKRQDLSIELLNALAVASIGLPMEKDRNIASCGSDLIRKRHGEGEASLLSVQAKKKAKIVGTNCCALASEESVRSSKRSSRSRKKKASRLIQKSKKESVPKSKTSATYEDAQLLFDTFVTFASTDNTALNKSSTVSIDSEDSIMKYEDFAANGKLTSPEYWDKVPRILSISMAQMSLTAMKPNAEPKTTKLGHAALCCRHCKGVIGFGTHFFKSLRQGNHIHRIMKHVQSNCTACPTMVRSAVQKLCSPIKSDTLGLTLSNSFETNSFFEHIWNQLCIAGFIDDKASDTGDDTVTSFAGSKENGAE